MGGWVNLARALILWLLAVPSLSQVQHPLPVLWVMPLASRPGQENLTAALLPAIQLALQDLSRQPPPLRHYQIQFDIVHAECENAKGLKAFFDAMRNGPKYLMVFGGVCPSVTSMIAQSLPGWNLVQLSFATPLSVVADRRKYPHFFCTVPLDSALNQAVVQVLREYTWSRVALLTQEGQRFSEMKSDLTKQLRKANVELAVTERLSDSPCISLQRLKDNNVWIIIGLFDDRFSAKVFCCAHHLNMFGRRYQWIIPRGYKEGWGEESNISKCTEKSILTAMEGHISVDFRHLGDRQIRSISGRTPREYAEMYNRELQQKGLAASEFHGFAYDGVWVMAKALSQVMESLRQREIYDIHRNFTVSHRDVERMILRSMTLINFEGVTGQVLFRNGERVGTLQLSQFQAGRAVEVGQYDTGTEVLKLIHRTVRFQGAGPAKDRTTVRLQRWRISVGLYSVLSSITGLAILVAFTFFFFIINNRNHRLVKTSGLLTEILVFLGTVLSSSASIISGLDGSLVSDDTFEVLCSIRTWLLSVGHSAAFGALLVKVWRVYTNEEKEEKRIKVHQPVALVGGLLLTDLGILTCWQSMDPLTRTVSECSLLTDPAAEHIVIRPFVEHCESRTFWLGILYGYKAPLMLLGCFLAWRIRKFGAPLAVSVWTVTALCACGVSASLLTNRQPNLQLLLLTLAILLCNACTLCLFVPKILQIRANPDTADQAMGLQPPPNKQDCGSVSSVCGADPDGTRALLKRQNMENQHLHRQITQLDSELEIMSMRLEEDPELSPPGEQDSRRCFNDTAGAVEVSSTFRRGSGGGWSSCVELAAAAQYRDENGFGSLSEINSPENIQRRLSMQLPILHHAYMPTIGGVHVSCSSLGSQS